MKLDVSKMGWMEKCHLVTHINNMKAKVGIQFNKEKAMDTWHIIKKEMDKIEAEVNYTLPLKKLSKSNTKNPPARQFVKSGDLSKDAVKYFEGQVIDIKGPCNAEVVYPDGSIEKLPTQRPLRTHTQMTVRDNAALKTWLMEEHNWVPVLDWNVSKATGGPTSPKVHINGNPCPGLGTVDWPHIEKFIRFCSIKHRHEMIWGPKPDGVKDTGLLGNPRLAVDGRISAGYSGITPTHRQRHKDVVNLPGVKRSFGKEIRGCFEATPGNVVVGYDASSLEARIKGSLTYKYDGGEYARKILSEGYDEHLENAKLWFDWFEDNPKKARTDAKPGTYALPYGCSYKKLGSILKCGDKEGKRRFDAYWKLNDPIVQRAKELEKQWKSKKHIVGLDGRPFKIRSKHSLFNTDCQGGGSIVMDISILLMYSWADRVDDMTGTYYFKGLPAKLVLSMHDEYLWDCHPDIADYLVELGCESIRESGRILKLNVDLDAEGEIGENYAEVH